MKYLLFVLAICMCHSVLSQTQNDIIKISDDVELIKLSDHAYIHVTYHVSEKWGRMSANGLIFIDANKAFLFDTPWTEEQTKTLVSWFVDSLGITFTGFVPTHWHVDCIGGLDFILDQNIKTYANQMTIDIANSKELSAPEVGFTESLHLQLGNKQIKCYYLGAGHSLDNIVMWIPSEKILFAGCLLKGLSYKNIGFTGDGDLKEYPNTLNKILAKFPNAEIVIPGHGEYGGVDIIRHNQQLIKL